MKATKILAKAALLGVGAYLGMFLVYWFNIENKVIFYAVRPLLNKIYDSKDRDVKI